MTIGGLQKFSLIEYPGKTSAIIFTRGCNFRCPYCHNPELVLPEQYAPEIPLEMIFDFLETRRGKLDAVSITGGEPTLHDDLIELIKRLKGLKFLIKLESNGSRPEVLKSIIEQNLIDYLAIDIKAPLEKYEKVAGCQVSGESIRKSIQLTMDSGVDYEFRTTVMKSLTNKEDMRRIAVSIMGAKRYFLQKFTPSKLVDDRCNREVNYSDEELNQLAQEFMKHVEFCGVR